MQVKKLKDLQKKWHENQKFMKKKKTKIWKSPDEN